MYNPENAKKPYLILLKENGLIAGIKSAALIFFWLFINKFIMNLYTPPSLTFIYIYIFLLIFYMET